MSKFLSIIFTTALAFCFVMPAAHGQEGPDEEQKSTISHAVSCQNCQQVHLDREQGDSFHLLIGWIYMSEYPEVTLDCLINHIPFIHSVAPENRLSAKDLSQIPHLKMLRLAGDESKLTSKKFSSHLMNLYGLSLTWAPDHLKTDQLLAGLPNLRFFEFSPSELVPAITGKTLSPTLTKLDLNASQYVHMRDNLGHLSNLTSLQLEGCGAWHPLNDDAVAHFATHFPNLTHLDLNHTMDIIGKTLSPKLTTLCLGNCSNFAPSMELGLLTNLTSLTLHAQCKIGDWNSLTSLNSLTLINCCEFPSDRSSGLPFLDKLIELRVVNPPINFSLSDVQTCKQLILGSWRRDIKSWNFSELQSNLIDEESEFGKILQRNRDEITSRLVLLTPFCPPEVIWKKLIRTTN